jgi:hypothetical protein
MPPRFRLAAPSLHPQIFRTFLATVRDNIERDLRALGQRAEARFFDSRNMDEDVLAAAVRRDEAISPGD